MQIIKISKKHKTATFVALVPDEVDRNGDIISEDEIIKTAHEFGSCMCHKKLNIDHDPNQEIDSGKYAFVENFVLPQDLQVKNEVIPKGSWLVGIRFFDDALWEKIENGEIVGISIEGWGQIKKTQDSTPKKETRELENVIVEAIALVSKANRPAVPKADIKFAFLKIDKKQRKLVEKIKKIRKEFERMV